MNLHNTLEIRATDMQSDVALMRPSLFRVPQVRVSLVGLLSKPGTYFTQASKDFEEALQSKSSKLCTCCHLPKRAWGMNSAKVYNINQPVSLQICWDFLKFSWSSGVIIF